MADRAGIHAPTPSRIRLSCAISAFPRLSHDGALAVIRDLGIEAVDVFVLTGSWHTAAESGGERRLHRLRVAADGPPATLRRRG
jgi:hypothetical protein